MTSRFHVRVLPAEESVVTDEVRQLLLEIVHCPVVPDVLRGGVRHPCGSIVRAQAVSSLADVQVPEPWTGAIERAPILFVGSNPNLSTDSVHPLWCWPGAEVEEHFRARFDGDLIVDGVRYRRIDGSLSRIVPTWAAQRAIAGELLGRAADPGRDYAITNVVHCKSNGEVGVRSAVGHCADRYLDRVLALAPARVLVLLGGAAAGALRGRLPVPTSSPGVAMVRAGGRRRAVIRLAHPAAREAKRSLAESLEAAGSSLAAVRSILDGEMDAISQGQESRGSARLAPATNRSSAAAAAPLSAVDPPELATVHRFLSSVRDGCRDAREGLRVSSRAPTQHYVRIGRWWCVAVERSRDSIRIEVLLDTSDPELNSALYERLLANAALRERVPGIVFDPPAQARRRKAGVEWGPIPDLAGSAGMSDAVRTTVTRMLALYDATAHRLP